MRCRRPSRDSPQTELRLRGPQREKRKKEKHTLFFNLSHESYSGHEYHLVTGTLRRRSANLRRRCDTRRARRSNNLLASVPDNQITHVAETVELHADSMNFGYVMKDANTTTGKSQMSHLFPLFLRRTQARHMLIDRHWATLRNREPENIGECKKYRLATGDDATRSSR